MSRVIDMGLFQTWGSNGVGEEKVGGIDVMCTDDHDLVTPTVVRSV
jgi:hypothetical protein